jgi:TetR/AcrR family transcriptional repressor of nem operon
MTKAERTRQFIIERSAPLLNTKGIAGTAMSDIMTATKMAKGGLYGNFESKEELANAVVDHNLKLLSDSLTAAIAQADTAKEKLFAFLDFFKTPVQFPVQGGCPILNFGVESDDTDPIIKEKVKQKIESAKSKAASLIQLGIKNGEFKESFDAKEFPILMFSALEGGTLIGRVLNTNKQMNIVINMLKKMIEDQLA